jgi:ribosomal protein L24E
MTDSTLALSPRQLRDELERLILADLLGPAGGDYEEVDEARVSERYLVGLLAPRRARIDGEEAAESVEDDLAVAGAADGDEGAPELVAPPIDQLVPSAIGLTFAVENAVDVLKVTASWGAYRRETSETIETAAGNPKVVWRRTPAGGRAGDVALISADIKPFAPDPEYPDVIVRGRVRERAGQRLVTLFLVNDQPEPEQRKDEVWVFQAELQVAAAGGQSVFVRRALPQAAAAELDGAERRALDMRYRDDVELAVGHGTAVAVERDAADPARGRQVRTVVAPAYEVPLTEAPGTRDNADLTAVTLDMARLAAAGDGELPSLLLPLAEAYETWIAGQEKRIALPEARLAAHEGAAEAALRECGEAAGRIRAGIAALADPKTAEAFRFANEAMARQRVRTLAADRQRAEGGDVEEHAKALDVPESRSWRPFQLAFVLLNLPGIADLGHPERRDGTGLVDLLWFPTGGGKTEAYLGLTAFTLALRRLQGEVAGHDGREGVGVLMRYTLRLLTLQQFQRATALMCAMELMRLERISGGDDRWGPTPFRIGLWVGQRSTPNRTADADEWVKARRGRTRAGAGGSSPAQLTRCPWCGTEIDPGRHIHVDRDRGRTLLFCGDQLGRCPFTRARNPDDGLPAVVVDEEIYRLVPGLLIATVDKFAQMPWRGSVQTLFGRVGGRCERHGFRHPGDEDADSHPVKGRLPKARTVPALPLRPPDLVIQDELHLISGPLGSLVGLYETAVDQLARWNVGGHSVRPKVIASTATIRRASHQVHQLFDRDVRIFPPAGLDARDSFFALQRDRPEELEAKPGRRYLGICAPGRRLKAALIRVYVAQMAAAQTLLERHPDAQTYMTLVGYFNSLRELGGMRRLVEDDVATRLGKADERGLARRSRPDVEELTSRKSAEQIPEVLDRLAVAHVHPRPGRRDAYPVDVVLATNMISVGVDVPRLGAMVCAGQPKSTSEYIQATSRVGRSTPGLVITVYNWARPRDLSHYETFEHYHATFYRHVEAISVTPFAPRALDRGLTGVLTSLLRLDTLEWSENHGAERIDRKSPTATGAAEAVVARAGALTSSSAVADDVRSTVTGRLDQLAREQAVTGRRLGYRQSRDGQTYGLLKEPGAGRWTEWTAPTSLREVEPEIRLILQPDAGGAIDVPWTYAAPETGE